MLFNFFKYLYDMDNDGIGNYLNCYSTYLMTKKDIKDNILYHRMNVLINYYISNTLPPPRKYDLYSYYLSNWTDEYLNKYQTPPYIHNNNVDKWDLMDEDVRDHYKFMITRPPPEPEIDYDEYDKQFYQEDEEKRIDELNKQFIDSYNDGYEDDWECDCIEYDIENDNIYDYCEYE